ncbi:iron ABC transporter permease [Flexivirga caeni]|uniref:Iron ABC transporter permease n=2 Tax=Flexivirga caeni TaxID=2294115 RepID=A0A3M9M480_9MICO|nr:iron ABC transporter permease [Flexivirga caeni]
MDSTVSPTKASGRAPLPAPAGRRGPSRASRVALVTVVLVVAVVVVAVLSASVGQFDATPRQVVSSFGRGLFHSLDGQRSQVDTVLWNIRFPRVALGLVAGAALAVAGAVMQGVFANPLAEPSIIGVNSGASVGATLVIVTGAAVDTPWLLPAAAFASALLVTLVVWALAQGGGKAAVLTLVLTGIAVNAITASATSFLIFLGDTSAREEVIFWQLGSLADASWSGVVWMSAVFAAGFAGCMAIRRRLDALALGDASATASGVNVERLRIVAILLACLLTGAAVAFGGVIAFVGLIVPHAIRLLVGPSHRHLVPLSALGGAVLLEAADIAARTVIPFADMPIGIFTALAGGPVFLLLLRRTLRGHGVGAR